VGASRWGGELLAVRLAGLVEALLAAAAHLLGVAACVGLVEGV
jgi:hypothetical protein